MELTDKNYKQIIKNNDVPVYIDFYSPTCGPCQVLLELIDNGLDKYADENGVKVVKCNIAKNSKLSEAFKIRSVPFTIAVMPDEKLLYPELGLKENAYYFGIIDKLSRKVKGSFFSKLFG